MRGVLDVPLPPPSSIDISLPAPRDVLLRGDQPVSHSKERLLWSMAQKKVVNSTRWQSFVGRSVIF